MPKTFQSRSGARCRRHHFGTRAVNPLASYATADVEPIYAIAEKYGLKVTGGCRAGSGRALQGLKGVGSLARRRAQLLSEQKTLAPSVTGGPVTTDDADPGR